MATAQAQSVALADEDSEGTAGPEVADAAAQLRASKHSAGRADGEMECSGDGRAAAVAAEKEDAPAGQPHKAEPQQNDGDASYGISDAATIGEIAEEAAATVTTTAAAATGSLPHAQSSPSLLQNVPLVTVKRADGSEAAAISTSTMPDDVCLMGQPRPPLASDTSSIDSSDSAGDAASVAQTPSQRTKSNSSKPGRDTSLRIFFPTDDLALKAILSPPTLRPSVSTGNVRAQPEAKPSLAESFLETTSRLFFLRGINAATTTNALTAAAASAKESSSSSAESEASATGRASTTALALEDDLSRLDSTIVAASPNLPPPPFANMFTCESCHDNIGSLLTQGRHHCRNCGGSFCAACSTKTSIVPFQLYLHKGEQRVCDGCFNRIRDFHAQAQTMQITWSGLPPPPSGVLVREFDLPPHETPVTVFNCSYFVDFAPFYGHLFITREHVCFRGYKTHKIKIAFADLHALIKPEFYYINALQINTKSTKEKHFFAEFNGLRDLCFLRLDQLIRAYQDGKKQLQTPPMSSEDLKHQALQRRRSYKRIAAASGGGGATDDLANFVGASATGSIDVDDEDDDDSDKRSHVAYSEDRDEAMSTTSSASDDGAEPFVPLPPDALLARMTTLLDCELRADTQTVFELLWGNGLGKTFLRDHMEKTKDIDIEIEDWQEISSKNEEATAKGFAVSKEGDYSLFRNVRSQHPPKTQFPGLPPYATCCRLQRLRVEKAADGKRWSRFVVSDLLRMAKIPFSDYFEIETRWVFTRDGKNYCHVQAGLVVNFIKSTWFKSQIDSSTRSESKEGQELWAKNAMHFLQENAASVTTRSSLMVKSASSTGEDQAAVETVASRRLSAAASEKSVASSVWSATTAKTVHPTVQPGAAHGPTDALSLAQSLLSSPQSVLQLVTLVLLLYCVVVIQNQHARLQQLSDTTAMLVAKLQSHDAVPTSGRDSGGSVCEQRLVEGAATALADFFKSQRP